MKKVLSAIATTILLSGCVSTYTPDIDLQEVKSMGYTVDEKLIKEYENLVITDPLEGNLYYRAYDYNDWLLGNSYYRIKMSNFPDISSDVINVEVRTMNQTWVHADSVSIYVNKKKLVDKWNKGNYTNTSIVPDGSGAGTVWTHEYFSIPMSVEKASIIADAIPTDVVLRFHTKQGYVDQVVIGYNTPGDAWSDFSALINLAQTTAVNK